MSTLERIHTDEAPAAIGPYAQAVVAGGFVYTSGQIAIHPETGNLVQDSFEAEVGRVFDNLEAVLRAAGTSLARVVKASIYVTDLDRFQVLNRIYAERMGDARPARSTVQVARLPKGARVEIDMVAVA